MFYILCVHVHDQMTGVSGLVGGSVFKKPQLYSETQSQITSIEKSTETSKFNHRD